MEHDAREKETDVRLDNETYTSDLEDQTVDRNGMKKDMGRRHINMIAIAGIIGTGLFLASGQAIALAGPVGALLGYMVIGMIACSVAFMTGELSTFLPVTGGFVRHTTKFIQPALGIATGWNYWYAAAITAPAELVAAATLIQFWDTTTSPAVFLTVFIVVVAATNFCGVRFYGESEVFFATLKILLIIGLIIAGLAVNLGGSPNGDRIGFRYWRDPGVFNTFLVGGNTGRFLAFWSTLLSAAYSYAGIQAVALAGTETRNPRVIIPNAIKMTFWRVLIFYLLSLFIVGMLVPYDDPNLGIATGTAQQSPYVIAFQRAGVKVVPSIVNAVVCTSAYSAASANLFLASRTLYGFAEEGQAPKIFLRTNRLGSPYMTVSASLIWMPLVYLTLDSTASVVFGWFVNIITIAGLLGWLAIAASFLRFYYAMKLQNISRDRLPYKSPFQPYMAWMTAVVLALVILFSGYSVFFPGRWDVAIFLTNYINLPIFLSMWVVAWIFTRSPFIPLKDIDLSEIHVIDIELEKQRSVEEVKSWWRRWLI